MVRSRLRARRSVYLIERYWLPLSLWWMRPPLMSRLALMDGLLQGVENEAGMSRPAHPPADDPPGVGIDDECDIDKPVPGRDVGEVRDPQPVGSCGMELAIHLVERARRSLVTHRGADRFAADNPFEAQFPHQPLHRAAGHVEALALHLTPYLAYSVDPEVLGEDSADLRLQDRIAPGPGRKPGWLSALCGVLMVGGRGNRQNPADRLDPVGLTVLDL